MKKLFLLCAFFIFNLHFSFSQNKRVTIVDSLSNRPVKFANVNFLNGFGVFSNENGKINVSDINVTAIEISHISYESKKVDFGKTNDSIIFLTPKIIKLNEIFIEKRSLKFDKTIITKPKKHSNYNEMYFTSIGFTLAFKINSIENKINFLRSIELPLFKKSNDETEKLHTKKLYPYKTLIKIEILESIDDKPGENLYEYTKYEIINSELINDSFTSIFEKKIRIPENGLYVAVTFIGTVDANNLLVVEMPYDINLKYPNKKFIKYILPNIPIIDRQNDTKTFFKFDYDKSAKWNQIEKPIIYNKNKIYPIFDVGIGYKIDLME